MNSVLLFSRANKAGDFMLSDYSADINCLFEKEEDP